MKYALVLLLTLACSCAPTNARLWVPLSLGPPPTGAADDDPRVTVQFPSQPVEITGQQALPARTEAMVLQSRAYRAEDAAGVYMLVSVPLPEAPQLPASLEERTAYYANAGKNMVAKANGTLLEQTMSELDGTDLITIRYRAASALTGAEVVKYIRMVTVGKTVYQLHFVPKGDSKEKSQSQRVRFLDSIHIERD